MRPWFSRNARALVAVAVLAPLTIGVVFWKSWSDYFGQRPSIAVVAEAGETADFADTGWTVLRTERITSDSASGAEYSLPEGSDLVVVTVRVDTTDRGTDGSLFCDGVLVEHRPGDVDRRWGDALTSGIDYRSPDDVTYGCDSEQTGAYDAEWTYVIPSDAGDELALAVEVVEEFPNYLELPLSASSSEAGRPSAD